jgi:hypothetical protein
MAKYDKNDSAQQQRADILLLIWDDIGVAEKQMFITIQIDHE